MARPPFRPRRAAGLALGLLLAAAPAHPAEAQYFGRNKVQYERFDFRVMKTEHFDVYFSPGEVTAARGGAPPAAGRYCGLDRGERGRFGFRVRRTEDLDVYFYPEEEAAARDAARMAERWYARL